MSARLTIFRSHLPNLVRRETLSQRQKIGNAIVGAARSAAPILTGAYYGGISVETHGLMVSVVDTDETSIHKEYGTSDTPAHAALTNAALSYGRYSGMRPKRGR